MSVCPDAPPEVQKSGVQPWHCCHKLIYVRPNPKTGVPIGHWPIPEAFWPDQNSPTLVRKHCEESTCILQDQETFLRVNYPTKPKCIAFTTTKRIILFNLCLIKALQRCYTGHQALSHEHFSTEKVPVVNNRLRKGSITGYKRELCWQHLLYDIKRTDEGVSLGNICCLSHPLRFHFD